MVFDCDTHAGVESKQLFDIPNSNAMRETECTELDAVTDHSSDASEGSPHTLIESEQSINASSDVMMVLCKELTKASGLSPSTLVPDSRAITAQRCEHYHHEQEQALLFKLQSPCDASYEANQSQLLQSASYRVTDTSQQTDFQHTAIYSNVRSPKLASIPEMHYGVSIDTIPSNLPRSTIFLSSPGETFP